MKTTHEMTQSVIENGRRRLRKRRALKSAAGAALGAGIVAGAFFFGMSVPKPERGVDLVESSSDLSADVISIPSSGASELSLLSEDGTSFRTVANSVAIAFMRNDSAELSKYLADPDYHVGLDEGNTELFDNLQYVIIADMEDNYGTITSDENGVFFFAYKIDMIGVAQHELKMGLKKFNGEWKVLYLNLE